MSSIFIFNHQPFVSSKTLTKPSYYFHIQNLLPFQKPNLPHRLIRFRSSAAAVNHADSQTLPQSAIKRIAEKLRSLGYVSDDEDDVKRTDDTKNTSPGEIFIPLPKHLPKYRVGHTIDTSWSTPENPVPEPGFGNAIQRFHELRNGVRREKIKEKEKGIVERKEKVPTFAELTLPKEELRRLRASGIGLKLKLKVGKAGITEGIVNGIHERWRNTELVKIVCDDICRLNMQRTHDLLEKKTGGIVIWRSGSKIILYRGANYKYPYFSAENPLGETKSREDSAIEMNKEEDSFVIEDTANDSSAAAAGGPSLSTKTNKPPIVKGVGYQSRVRFQLPGELQMIEEADRLLDGLGPRFTDWWGCEPLPVDADLLPAVIPGFKKPFRLLPYGVKPTLTNDELTILKRLGRPLPCHFALSRNRKLQGLAASIVKLWEKCEIVKVAVKRGAQNTNSQLMAEELKRLTGGSLLSRDSEFFVLYRGKDFLPAAVSSAIEDRRKNVNRVEKKALFDSKLSLPEHSHNSMNDGSQDDCDVKSNQINNPLSEEMKLKTTEAAIKRTSSKLETTLQKKMKAEKLLAELEKEELHQVAEVDKEGITKEERFMLRKVGLQMGPFLLLGRRGVFDGTIENMHLHWKYRELVKIICGGRNIEEIHGVARVLEAESGGILIAVERVSKGFAIIVYRGKNYERPTSLRPETLLNKKEAMKRSLEAQRRESLKLHVLKLNDSVDDLKLQLDKDKETIRSLDLLEVDGSQASAEQEHKHVLNEATTIAGSSHKETLASSSVSDQAIAGSSHKETLASSYVSDRAIAGSTHKETLASSSVSDQGDDTDSVLCHDDNESLGAISFIPKNNKKFHVFHGNDMKNSDKPSRSLQLSNKEKLALRKQALSMKKRQRPVLAVGKSNSITGIAKTINTHFEKHPLAIVNVKGRAKGTSVQELVFKLEEATGSVLVSQEPSKVILYRGQGAGDNKLASRKSSKKLAAEGRNGEVARSLVSPQLLMAMRIECGLLDDKKEQDEEDEVVSVVSGTDTVLE
ncbi:CRM-domain containing factor CFM2, chloroplastic [Impatiens glandulifera]|uniref:CRM-domain containing factor CFM2, chloroplastic n=1 Tax=Impatiens glandulifera TaxID=253017 RepID=UPI001FB0A274|nr:CRM-domain containing factor CFM2, chloroplastic [Impatiens glandulifera]